MINNKITVLTGPMFAGKTKTLIEIIKKSVSEPLNLNVLVFKPNIDNRYELHNIVSHDNMDLFRETGIRPILLPLECKNTIKILEQDRIDLVVFDEIQFFSVADIIEEVKSLQEYGIKRDIPLDVLCVGLNLTSSGESFGAMPQLMAMADEIIMLKSKCVICGNTATRTYRKIENKELHLVGGKDLYEPRCLKHWY